MHIIMAANGYEGVFTTWLQEYNIPYTLMLGANKGVHEQSFQISLHPDNHADFITLMTKAKEYKQECVLLVSEENEASLIFMDGNTENIGFYTKVPRHVAHEIGCYTMNRDTQEYFTCLKNLPETAQVVS